MARLIDADELKEHLFVGAVLDKTINYGIARTEEEVFAFRCGWNDALKSVVQFAPTVDAEPVVRCKDCKYCSVDRHADGNVPNYVCIEMDCGVEADSFCSLGERRKHETD